MPGYPPSISSVLAGSRLFPAIACGWRSADCPAHHARRLLDQEEEGDAYGLDLHADLGQRRIEQLGQSAKHDIDTTDNPPTANSR